MDGGRLWNNFKNYERFNMGCTNFSYYSNFAKSTIFECKCRMDHWIQRRNSLNGIEIIDASNVYIVGDFGILLKTTNGGTTWTQIPSDPTTFLYGVVFYSATIGWVAGDGGVIMNTTDGGITWNFQTTPTQNTLWDIELIRSGSSGVLYAAGDGGTILCSGIS